MALAFAPDKPEDSDEEVWTLVSIHSEGRCTEMVKGKEVRLSNSTCYVPKELSGIKNKPYSYREKGNGLYNYAAGVPITSTFQADLDRVPSRASRKNSNTFISSYPRAITKKAQKKLAAFGFDVGTPDGIAGTKTRQAIEGFQKLKGWEVTGVIDDKLLAYFDIKHQSVRYEYIRAGHKSQSRASNLSLLCPERSV